MRVFLGNDANYHKSVDIRCIDVPRNTDDGCNDLRQCCIAQHDDRTVKCIPMGIEWVGRSVDFIETCAKIFRRKQQAVTSFPKKTTLNHSDLSISVAECQSR